MKKPIYPPTVFRYGTLLLLFFFCACDAPIPCTEENHCIAPDAVADSSLSPNAECLAPTPASLRINEILVDPNGYDINIDQWADPFEDEFIEILNVAPTSVNLDGISVRIGSRYPHRFETFCLPPGEAVVVFGGGYDVPNSMIIADHQLKLPNQGGHVALVSINDTLLDSVSYGDEAIGSHSLSRVPDGGNTWAIHPGFVGAGPVTHSAGLCTNGGQFPRCMMTPPNASQQEDDCSPLAPNELIINEVLSDPGHKDANGDGAPVWYQDEFIELVLTATGSRQLEGVSVQVNDRERHRFSFACMEPGTGLVLFAGGHPAHDKKQPSRVMTSDKTLGLPNIGGMVSLMLGSTLIDRMTYGLEAGKEQSVTRSPDGHGPFVPHSEADEGLSFSPGTCVNGAAFGTGCLNEEPKPGD